MTTDFSPTSNQFIFKSRSESKMMNVFQDISVQRKGSGRETLFQEHPNRKPNFLSRKFPTQLIDELAAVLHPLFSLPTSSSSALLAKSPVGIRAVGNGGDNFTIHHYIKPPLLRSEATSTVVPNCIKYTHVLPQTRDRFSRYIRCGLNVPSLFGLTTSFVDSFPKRLAVCLARRKQFL